MTWHATMLLVNFALLWALIYLVRHAPDRAQRVGLILLIAAYSLSVVTWVAILANGHDREMRSFLRACLRLSGEIEHTGLIVIILRLVWREWVCLAAPRSSS